MFYLVLLQVSIGGTTPRSSTCSMTTTASSTPAIQATTPTVVPALMLPGSPIIMPLPNNKRKQQTGQAPAAPVAAPPSSRSNQHHGLNQKAAADAGTPSTKRARIQVGHQEGHPSSAPSILSKDQGVQGNTSTAPPPAAITNKRNRPLEYGHDKEEHAELAMAEDDLMVDDSSRLKGIIDDSWLDPHMMAEL